MRRVLVIDDDYSVGAAIHMTLARNGCDVVLAPDAHAGVQAFESSKFDIAIVDIFMPEMNGLDIISGFRQQAPTVPIVAISGFWFSTGLGLDYLSMAAKLGAACCLRKPFAPEQLMAAINMCLDPAFSSGHSFGSRKTG